MRALSKEDRLPGERAPFVSEGKVERRRILVLSGILAFVVLAITTVTVHVLFWAALGEEFDRLLETARIQARLIEAIARHHAQQVSSPEDVLAATLVQVADAHERNEGFGETGELALARLDVDRIVYLVNLRHHDSEAPQTVRLDSELGEPMRRALEGRSGTLLGLDYRGARVIAAHEPVGELDLGIVAKIDVAEFRRPFVLAGLHSFGPAMAAVLLAAWIFTRVTRPIVRRIGEGEQRYRDLVESMNDGLGVQDSSRRMVYVNDRFCEIVGRSRAELVGHPSDKYLTPSSRDEFARQMAHRERGAAQSYQLAFVRSDGSTVDVLLSPRPVLDAKGRFAGSFAVISDITELKRAESQLRREKERTQQYLETAGILFLVLDRSGSIELINPRGAEILGYDDPSQLIGRNWVETCIPTERREDVREALRLWTTGEAPTPPETERSVLTRDGTLRFISWRNSVLRDDEGNVAGALGAGIDVTERRRVEERFRVIAEVASDLIYEWDAESGALRWYGDINGTLGYPPGTIAPTVASWQALVHPEDLARLDEWGEQLRASVLPLSQEYRVRHFDGTWRYWIDRSLPIVDGQDRIARWIGACVDISDVKRNEAALARRADQLQTVSEVGRRLSSILDIGDLFQDVAQMLHERFGYYHVDVFVVDEAGEYAVFRAGSNPAIAAAWRERGLRFAVGREGMIGWAAQTGELLLANDVAEEPHFLLDELLPETRSEIVVPIAYEGRVTAVLDIQSDRLGAFRPDDLTVLTTVGAQLTAAIVNARLYEEAQRELNERKQVEKALRSSEQQYKSLFDNAVLGIYKTTPDGRILAANPALVRILGYDSLAELEQRNLEDRGYAPDYPREEFKARMEKDGAVSGFVSGWAREDGTTVHVRENAKAARNEEGKILFYEGTIEDITDQREAELAKEALEAQLVNGQKLESIGTLASGVAHEINNPLTGIINYAQLIGDRIDDETLSGFAAGIVREGNRVATIVKNLLDFSRQEKQRHSLAEVGDMVDVVVSLVGAVLRRDQIDLRVEIPAGLPKIKCRSQQIEQVLLNLVTNARDALNRCYPGFDEGKILRITSSLRDVEGRPWIRLTVEDHGAGIPDEIVDRIFDPFFTTKSRTEGTGLGLSISHGIIRDHHGTLSVERGPGEPTRFAVDLPVDNDWVTTKESEGHDAEGEALEGESA